MAEPSFKFKPTGAIGEYTVCYGGANLGTVQKWERRYNLRRVYVSRGWRATTPEGRRLYTTDGSTGETRQFAAWALLHELHNAELAATHEGYEHGD